MSLDPLYDPDHAPDEIERLEEEIDLRQAAIGDLADAVAERDRELFDLRRRSEADRREIARLERIANARYVRVGLIAYRALRALRGRVSSPTNVSSSPSSGAAARRPGAAVPPARGGRPPDPAAFGRDLLARLAGAGAGGPPLRVAWEAGPGRDVTADLRGQGWQRSDATDADVLVIEDPERADRPDPGAVSVAIIDAPEPWIDRPWFDDVDLVLVRDADDAGRIRAATAHEPRLLAKEDRPPGRLGEALRAELEAWLARPRIDLLVGVPSWDVAPAWGDTHYARALQRAFARRGWSARVRILPELEAPSTRRADVVLHLFGLKERTLDLRQLNVLWVISHPDRVTDALLADQDLVFVASERFARSLSERTGRQIHALSQATDPERFSPTSGADGPATELLYVANSRGVRRRIVADLTPTTRDLAVYGQKWYPTLLDPRYLRADGIPNAALAGAYRSAAIVLNDHWPDMAEHGFLSNRLYDALASGAFVVSDHVDEMDAEFDGAVPTYRTPRELRTIIRRFLADPGARREHAERGRRAVLDRHTFGHRVDALLARIEPLLEDRRSS